MTLQTNAAQGITFSELKNFVFKVGWIIQSQGIFPHMTT
jgi:ABC-type proline/glycine betaine transport system ATPase subunit